MVTEILPDKHALNLLLHMTERGDNGLIINVSPKCQDNAFLFVGLKTLGTYDEFDWLVYCVKTNNCIFSRDNFVYHHWVYMYINLSAIVLSF